MKKTAKKSPQLLNGFPHIPFDEFPLKKSEDLVVVLEKNMPEGAKVESYTDGRLTPLSLLARDGRNNGP